MTEAAVFPDARATRLSDEPKTHRKLELNLTRNRKQDHTPTLDAAAAAFDFGADRAAMWNPEEHSLLYATPLWDGATADQRVLLNQLYWVAYYAQIVSAEIATIYFNQTSAAGLYGLEDFRLVCDTLDLESSQERAHIHAFRTVSDQVERALFGARLFTYPMRGPFASTMIYDDKGPFREWWRQLQLRTYGLLSSGNAFIGCQYFTVRGLRTLNGKMVQQELSSYHQQQQDRDQAPVPTKISYYHFMDESFHFNSSRLIGHEVVRCLPAPTAFERWVANLTVHGCQRDHGRFSIAVRGLFWHDPAIFPTVWRLLRSPAFGFSDADARDMLWRCFGQENRAMHAAQALHRTAIESYARYVEELPWMDATNREMRIMKRATLERYLAENRAALHRFVPPAALLA